MGNVDVRSVLDDAIADAIEDGNPIDDALKKALAATNELFDAFRDYKAKRSSYFSTKITDCELRSSDAWEAYMQASFRLDEAFEKSGATP
jgi:hypothetical protein